MEFISQEDYETALADAHGDADEMLGVCFNYIKYLFARVEDLEEQLDRADRYIEDNC